MNSETENPNPFDEQLKQVSPSDSVSKTFVPKPSFSAAKRNLGAGFAAQISPFTLAGWAAVGGAVTATILLTSIGHFVAFSAPDAPLGKEAPVKSLQPTLPPDIQLEVMQPPAEDSQALPPEERALMQRRSEEERLLEEQRLLEDKKRAIERQIEAKQLEEKYRQQNVDIDKGREAEDKARREAREAEDRQIEETHQKELQAKEEEEKRLLVNSSETAG